MLRRILVLLGSCLTGLLLATLFGSIFLGIESVQAVDHYYVDAVSGSNVTGDGTQHKPWQTISFALVHVSSQNVEIHVAAGLYDEALGETFPIVMEATVSLVGNHQNDTIIFGNGTDYVVHFPSTGFYTETTSLRGFKIMNGDNGVRMTGRVGTPSTPLITDNWITENRNGVVVLAVSGQSVDSIVLENRIEHNDNIGIVVSASFSGTDADATVSDNVITDNGAYGIFCFAHGTGSSGSSSNGRCHPTINNNLVANNTLSGYICKSQRTAHCSGILSNNQFVANGEYGIAREHVNIFVAISTPTIVNNIFVDNELGGAEFHAQDQPLFVNNTLAYNGDFGIRGGLPTIVNSIIWGHVDDLDAAVGQVSYSNISEAGYAGINNNLSEDPLFVDSMAANLHIFVHSPMVNVGNSGYGGLPATDFEGQPRIWGGGVDIGADEFNGHEKHLPFITQP